MVQVIERALEILEYIAREPETPRGLGEIAGQVELNAATCARILQTLVARGYVDQIAPKKGYRLGPMAYLLGARGPFRKDLVMLAEPLMLELARATRETVLLAALHQGRRILLAEVAGDQVVQIRGDQVQVFDPYRTATGRLLLAYLPAEARNAFVAANGLPEMRWPEAASPAGLEREMDTIRREGRVVRSDGHVAGVALPLREGDTVPAALGMYLPAHRFEGEHRERILAGMAATAAAITRRVAERGR